MIQLTTVTGTRTIYGKITSTERFKKLTRVTVEGGISLWVSETPEEIDIKINPWSTGKPKQSGLFLVKTNDNTIGVTIWDGVLWGRKDVTFWIEVPI